MPSFLAAISFDPNIRGVLVVMVAVIVLIGSIYLLVGTNTGARNGLLIVLACLTGWTFCMGGIWWVYGIGLRGKDPSWTEKEVNFSRDDQLETEVARTLPRTEDLPVPEEFLTSFLDENPDVAKQIAETEGDDFVATTLTKAVTAAPELKQTLDEELGGWRILSESDARRGEAVAAADATLTTQKAFGASTTSASYVVKDVFFFGGKADAEPETVKGERGLLDKAWRRVKTIFEPKNPPLYAAITVQKAEIPVVAPGEAPPPAQIDESAETVTVVLERNLGSRRVVPALFTLANGALFAIFAWSLHTRDKKAMARRANWVPEKA
jgi:hypothetical protein